ncbi:MAG: phosphate ABC transporter substrate-binding protein PstS [Acidobacteriaceae bacterium]|nr:phosphate ABC transporter substrate-binding protein PstS [Acidobacteriaceae bacterium]
MAFKPRLHNNLFVSFAISMLAGVAPISAQVQLTGAGATFPAPIYQKWFSDYQSVKSDVQINYQPIGSGGGIKNVTEGVVDFGASDGPMTDEQLKAYEGKHGSPILHFPTVLGAAVPTYNVPGVTAELNFTPEALAGIFLGKITKWNDPAIKKANPGVNLPDLNIIVAHRSEGSGTTYCWTDYLSKVSPEWKSKVGKNTSVQWPVGLGGKGNDAVAAIVKQQNGAIGYVELIYAIRSHLAYGKVQNKAGKFIKADLNSVTAAAASVANNMPADFRVSITDAPGAAAYPISTFTWLLIPSQIPDAQKRQALVGFLKWAITKGQPEVESLEYARLPAPVVSQEQAAIGKIK